MMSVTNCDPQITRYCPYIRSPCSSVNRFCEILRIVVSHKVLQIFIHHGQSISFSSLLQSVPVQVFEHLWHYCLSWSHHSKNMQLSSESLQCHILSQHSRIMSVTGYRSKKICSQSVKHDNWLKFESVEAFVSRVYVLLKLTRFTNVSDGSVNDPPTCISFHEMATLNTLGLIHGWLKSF